MASEDNKTQALDLFEGRQYKVTQGERKICVGVALSLLGNYLFNRGDNESFSAEAVSRCLEEHVRDVFWKIIVEDLKDGPKPMPIKTESVEDCLRRMIYSKGCLHVAIENMTRQEWEKGGDDDNWKFDTLKDFLCEGTDAFFQRDAIDGEMIGCLHKLLNGIVEAVLLEQNEKASFYAVRESFFPCDGKDPKFGFVRGCEYSEKKAGSCRDHKCNKCRESIYKFDFVDEPEFARNSIEANTLNDIRDYLVKDKVPVLMMIPQQFMNGNRNNNIPQITIVTKGGNDKNTVLVEPDHAVLITGYTESESDGNFNLITYEGAENCGICKKNDQIESKAFYGKGMKNIHHPILLPVQMTWGTKRQFYDVFIAYRHSSSKEFADYVYEQLTNEGFSVYMAQHEDNGLAVDVDSQCLRLVRSTKIFLLILSEMSLDEIEPDMTFYREIEYAYRKDESKNPSADGNIFMIFNDVCLDEKEAKNVWRKNIDKLISIRSKIKPTSTKYNSIYSSVKTTWLYKFKRIAERQGLKRIAERQGLKGRDCLINSEMLIDSNYQYEKILSEIFDYCMKELHGCFDYREVELINKNSTSVCIKAWILTCK